MKGEPGDHGWHRFHGLHGYRSAPGAPFATSPDVLVNGTPVEHWRQEPTEAVQKENRPGSLRCSLSHHEEPSVESVKSV